MKHLSNVSIEEYYRLNGTITDGHINELLDRAQKYEDLKTHIHAYLIDVRENFETDSDIFYLDIEE